MQTSSTAKIHRALATLLVPIASLALPMPSHAALFGDDEARKALLDLRQRFDRHEKLTAERLDDYRIRLERLESASRGQLELNNQLEQIRRDIANLRGEIETQTHALTTTQQKQRDLFGDLDARLKRFEPQQTQIDGKEARVDPAEQKSFNAAVQSLRNGDFKAALASFELFQRQYPGSAYLPQSWFWMGTAHYALRDHKEAIIAQKNLVSAYPDHPRVPDALLNIAASQTELKDKKAARVTLKSVIDQYPNAPAATTAKERLATLK